MSDKSKSKNRAILALGGGVVALTIGAVIWRLSAHNGAAPEQGAARSQAPRSEVMTSAPVDTVRGPDFTAWRPGEGLDSVLVNDILVADDGAWLGTGLGLVHIDSDGRTRSYRHFASAPGEAARSLVATKDGIGLTIMWTSGQSGGNRGATFLFDPATGAYQSVGRFMRALASDGDALYGVSRERIGRFEQGAANWTSVKVTPDIEICRSVDVTHADGALWLAHQGSFRKGTAPSSDKPCGVARLVPGKEVRSWNEDDGLVSGYARAIVADDNTVYVTHGSKGDGLSVYDVASRKWSPLNGKDGFRLRANVLGLSPNTIWLGMTDDKTPLVRVDRRSGKSTIVEGVPENHFVSAIAGDDEGAWVAWSKKDQDGERYAVTTWVARVRETASGGQ